MSIVFGLKRDPDWRRDRTVPCEDAGPCQPACRRILFETEFAALIGKRLLYFTDLHWNSRSIEDAIPTLEAINATEADWIVFGGDLVRHLEHAPAAFQILKKAHARLGKFAVLGNREPQFFWLDADFWYHRYREAGFKLLVNEAHDSDPGPVFVGMDDIRRGTPKQEITAPYASQDRFVVLATHSPDAVGHTTGCFIGHLVLAGHTHGGQWRLPGIGPIYTSSRYWRQFDLGWYRRQSDGTRMVVSAGLGTTGAGLLRRRFRCPTEIVLIEFVAPAQGSPPAHAPPC